MHCIYPKELEIKDTTDIVKSALYLDLHLENDGKGKLLTKLYDKCDDFSFRIFHFPFICGNIPSAPTYGEFISQLIFVPELAVNMHHLRNVMVVIMNIMDHYGASICTMKTNLFNVSWFLSSSVYLGFDFL